MLSKLRRTITKSKAKIINHFRCLVTIRIVQVKNSTTLSNALLTLNRNSNVSRSAHEHITYSPFERVVITGVGAVTCLGPSVNETWNNMIQGYSGLRKLEFTSYENIPCKVASPILRVDNEVMKFNNSSNNPPLITLFDPKNTLTKSQSFYKSHEIQYAVAAADEALNDSELIRFIEDDVIINKYRVGVIFGSGGIPLHILFDNTDCANLRTVSPYLIPNVLANSCSTAVSIKYGFGGPTLAPSTACAASAHAIQEGYLLIATGMCDVVVVGGSEAIIHPLSFAAFSRIKAMSTKYNDQPSKASRPWDKNRDGFVMSEGAGCIILESESFARQRGAKNIYGEVVGIGSTSDAFHVTNLDPSGKMIQRSMQLAIEAGKRITKDEHLIEKLGYINAHATSTQSGDKTELKAILGVLEKEYNGNDPQIQQQIKRSLKISSTKSSIGHLVGASGVVESIFCLKAMKTGIAPATLNLDEPDDFVPNYINLVPHFPQTLAHGTEYALSNSFGFLL
eukprot:75500_1